MKTSTLQRQRPSFTKRGAIALASSNQLEQPVSPPGDSTTVTTHLPVALPQFKTPELSTLTPTEEKVAAISVLGVIGAVLLVGFAVRAGVGHYVGKKLGSKWGWFWGGAFGVPGMGGLALYHKGRR